MVGLGGPNSDLGGLCYWHGLLSGCLELGLGRRDHAVRASGVGGRSDAAYSGLLSGLDHTDERYGVGMGCGRLGGHEIFPACKGQRGLD